MTDETAAISIRPLALADVPAMLRIEAAAYPPALQEGELVAYLIAHGWPARTPPPLAAKIATYGPEACWMTRPIALIARGP